MYARTPFRLNDHLRLLGLEGSHATANEIKHAFREQAKRHHPDVGGDPEVFKRICNSYGILTGKAQAEVIRNDFYSQAQASTPHWEYYYGTSRSRDGDRAGSEHGKHGADWANQQGPHANYSTRNFYRPYESSRGATGFTDEEIRTALRASQLHRAWRWTRNAFLAGGLYYCYATYRSDRIDSNVNAWQHGYDEAYWRMREEDKAKGLTTPVLNSYYERKKSEYADAQAEDAKRRKAMGIRNPFDQSSVPAGPQAVSFRGQPFTPEGLASSRKGKRALPITPAETFDDISYELEDIDKR
eukprot:GILI01030256.1.p1 GENE.GILI01030256.1~~GILI01030256.1.p1  ORF type:complete len:311 (-),score=26.09 GILI01030256.1:852-1748(-)